MDRDPPTWPDAHLQIRNCQLCPAAHPILAVSLSHNVAPKSYELTAILVSVY